jgi:exopolysaccharide production protein ExoZ
MRPKFLTIQYLRGAAAILVLASHALLYPLVEHDLGFGRLGWLGVILFFVISGFIMVAVTGEGTFSARDFLRRRFVRIVPMYWAATLLAAALALLAPSLFKTTVFDGAAVIQSLLFIPFHNAASGGIHPLYKLGWTLNYEVFFYVCFALLAFLEAGRRVVVLTAAFTVLALLGLVFSPEPAVPQFYTSFMPLAFCAGAWLGLATLRGGLQGLPSKAMFAVAALSLAGLVEGFAVDRHGLVEDGLAFIGFLGFASGLVLLAIRAEPLLPRIRLLETIGDASYSIYLVHIYEVALLSGLAFRLLDPHDLWADYFVAVVSVIGGTLAGLVVYRWMEMPLLAVMHRLWPSHRPRRPLPAE